MKVFLIILFVCALTGNQARAADPSEPTMPPVFVTSTRTETPLSQVTTSATVISAEQIREQQAETVLQVLRTVPGLDVVQNGSRGSSTSVFIRGSESDHVLVLIDGVEVNSTTLGAFDFANLTTENVERIEVLRGAGGTLYGSAAIGGVINIITKRGPGPLEFGTMVQGGNRGTHNQAFTLRGTLDKLDYSLSAARIQTNGFHTENDDYRNLATSARLDYRLLDDAVLRGIFHFVKTDQGLVNNNNFAAQPDPNARQAGTQYVGKLEWEQKIFKNWDYRVSGSLFKEHIKDSDDVDSCEFFGFPCDSRTRDRFRPLTLTGEFQTNYRWEEWSTTTFGVEYKRKSADTSGGIDEAVRNMGYYLQEQLQFLDRRLILIPAIRFDDNQSFGTAWTPSFSTRYLFSETGTALKASYAKGFKAPSLNELFFPPGFGCPAFGNPDLKAENSWEVNTGVEQSLWNDRVTGAVTYFHREVDDLIEGRPIPDDPFGCFRAQNVGRARFNGVESVLGIKLLASLTFNANYTYLHWDTADGTLPRRPHHRGSVTLNYAVGGFNFNMIGNIVGPRDDFKASSPFGNIVKPGYATMDLAASYSLPWTFPLVKNIGVFGEIQNVLNRKYEEADGFRARPLNFLVGMRVAFGR